MEQSIFLQWINKYFSGIALRTVTTLNDTTRPLTYLHKRMLTPELSITGKWESLSTINTLVAADVVAMDSSLPLKTRDTISAASGDIPKMGLELKLNEKQLTDLDTLVAQNSTGSFSSAIVAKLFQDTPKVIGGIYERNEAIFLEALSTGIALVDETETVGTGVRVDYGYKTANKFGVPVVWSNIAATGFDDIQRVIDKASLDGIAIRFVKIGKTAFDNLRKQTQIKGMFAFANGFAGSTTIIPNLSVDQLQQFASTTWGFQFEVIDRAVRLERNGVQTAVKPFDTHKVVFLASENVGALVYARLAEQNHPVQNVSYTTVDNFILVSKFRTNRPSLGEWTNSQARVVPVIANIDEIYTLDDNTVVSY